MNPPRTDTKIDYSLIFIILLLAIVSCFTLYTIQPYVDGRNYMVSQAVWYVLGSLVIGVIMLFDYDRLRQIVWFLYGIGMVSLLMLFFRFPASIIHEANGATSWFILPGVGTIQPAEFMKVVVIVTLAHIMVKHNEKFEVHRNKSDVWLLVKIAVVALPPMALIAVQPDLGGFLVFCAIAASMILVSGIRWRILFSVLLLGVLLIASVIGLSLLFPTSIGTALEESVFQHVESRFYGWLQPEKYEDSGYQLVRAMLAIGSGQLTGKGFQNMEVYIPERHTDMIFSAIAEQFGFIGASAVLLLFFLLIYRLIHIALLSNDHFGSFIVTGFIGMFTFQIFQNIGMSIQLLPITGLPLPFLSYGGSSTLTYLIAIGIALNIRYRRKEYMFD